MAVLKPRPSAGMMVDWQMKLAAELTNCSLCSSLLDTSVTLSVQTAALFPCSARHGRNLFGCRRRQNGDGEASALPYLVAAQADVEQVKVLGAFGGETGADGQRGHVAQRAQVKGQRTIVGRVGEGAVAVAARVFLKRRDSDSLLTSSRVCVLLDLFLVLPTSSLTLPGPQATHASRP